jgi:aquaporin Z
MRRYAPDEHLSPEGAAEHLRRSLPMSDPRPDKPVEPTPVAHAPYAPSTAATLVAEGFGTFLLVLGVISTALFAAGFGEGTEAANKGVGFVGVSLAVGITVIAGAYAFGPISGGHFNPAVTFGLAAAGRFPWKGVLPYVIAQIVGGAIATTLIVLIGLFGPDNWLANAQDGGFASNGWDSLSPAGFGIGAAIIVEVLFTALFVIVILGVTHATRGTTFAGLAIGLTLVLIHLAIIPIDNASVNPARSIATAIYGGPLALGQLWVFLVFPIVGALIAGFSYKALFDGTQKTAADVPFERSKR